MHESIQTLPERLHARAAESPDLIACLYRSGDKWQAVTWREFVRRVDTLAGHFARLGLRPGDRAAIMLPTSPEWEYCQFAALSVGAVVVGLDAHDAPRNHRHILSLTEPRLVVTSSGEKLRTLGELWHPPEIAITSDSDESCGSRGALAQLLDADIPVTSPPPPRPEDAATVVFTSGSTGEPRGIAYSHRQITHACDAIVTRFPSLQYESRLVCWLPLSNLFQRMINFCAMARGARIYFVDEPARILQLLPEIQPTFFIGVPRFFEKLYAGILDEIAKQPSPIRALVDRAWMVGCNIASAEREGREPDLLSRALQPLVAAILRRIRAIMGHKLQFIVSGSAPMPIWLLERFHGLGWLILEAYGISENVTPIAANAPDRYRFGSVGQPLPENELCLADDKELLVRGAGVFSGYYRAPLSESPLDPEGFLHTGDYARIDADGYLWLEGRKSDLFKTSTGRRIAPTPIEAALKQIEYVEHAVVVGKNRPYTIAILAFDPQHALAHRMDDEATAAAISADVAAACEPFADYQRPHAVIVSLHPFTVHSGELTSNLKIRRKFVEEHFSPQIEAAYSAAPPHGKPALAGPRVIITP